MRQGLLERICSIKQKRKVNSSSICNQLFHLFLPLALWTHGELPHHTELCWYRLRFWSVNSFVVLFETSQNDSTQLFVEHSQKSWENTESVAIQTLPLQMPLLVLGGLHVCTSEIPINLIYLFKHYLPWTVSTIFVMHGKSTTCQLKTLEITFICCSARWDTGWL